MNELRPKPVDNIGVGVAGIQERYLTLLVVPVGCGPLCHSRDARLLRSRVLATD